MAQHELSYQGPIGLGPEHFPCLVFWWPARGRVLPIWVEDDAGWAHLQHVNEQEGRRPTAIDLLMEVLAMSGRELSQVVISTYFNGEFTATLEFEDGFEMDARPSDATLLALKVGVPILAEEEVLNQASIFMNDEDLRTYLQLGPLPREEEPADVGGAGAASASGDAQADADFSALMAELGISEDDLSLDVEDDAFSFGETDVTDETDGADGTEDDNGAI
ncbi:bifunctional nuclease family protein [Corynebacterium kozikiae]|uniref:bifunctional nuclease family protein n=1 Tax=Corynebacterium kozikiae TaxID=2968469 RepID=UPI00211B83D2|nr:bifunctional nuclease family protein [Corynebacterium sp. 76QC2CO]MCQ9343852.1 bifunctional nuclease family protein [Corynebacterium sp. 76QC2CO]